MDWRHLSSPFGLQRQQQIDLNQWYRNFIHHLRKISPSCPARRWWNVIYNEYDAAKQCQISRSDRPSYRAIKPATEQPSPVGDVPVLNLLWVEKVRESLLLYVLSNMPATKIAEVHTQRPICIPQRPRQMSTECVSFDCPLVNFRPRNPSAQFEQLMAFIVFLHSCYIYYLSGREESEQAIWCNLQVYIELLKRVVQRSSKRAQNCLSRLQFSSFLKRQVRLRITIQAYMSRYRTIYKRSGS